MIVPINDVMRLWGELTSLRIDIALLKLDGTDPVTLRDREIKALQVGMELQQAVGGRLN